VFYINIKQNFGINWSWTSEKHLYSNADLLTMALQNYFNSKDKISQIFTKQNDLKSTLKLHVVTPVLSWQKIGGIPAPNPILCPESLLWTVIRCHWPMLAAICTILPSFLTLIQDPWGILVMIPMRSTHG
jgi:hypothetical protein